MSWKLKQDLPVSYAPDLNRTQFAVLNMIIDHVDHHHYVDTGLAIAWPSYKRMASKLRCSTDTIKRAVRLLAQREYLHKQQMRDEHNIPVNNLYTLNLERLFNVGSDNQSYQGGAKCTSKYNYNNIINIININNKNSLGGQNATPTNLSTQKPIKQEAIMDDHFQPHYTWLTKHQAWEILDHLNVERKNCQLIPMTSHQFLKPVYRAFTYLRYEFKLGYVQAREVLLRYLSETGAQHRSTAEVKYRRSLDPNTVLNPLRLAKFIASLPADDPILLSPEEKANLERNAAEEQERLKNVHARQARHLQAQRDQQLAERYGFPVERIADFHAEVARRRKQDKIPLSQLTRVLTQVAAEFTSKQEKQA